MFTVMLFVVASIEMPPMELVSRPGPFTIERYEFINHEWRHISMSVDTETEMKEWLATKDDSASITLTQVNHDPIVAYGQNTQWEDSSNRTLSESILNSLMREFIYAVFTNSVHSRISEESALAAQ